MMGQILDSAEPLPLDALNFMRSCFPDQREHYKVEDIVGHMGYLLSGTANSYTPIQPLHASFHDFLTDKSFSGNFFVEVSKVQCDLAFASLRVMEHKLRFNICDLKSSYIPNSEDFGLEERVKRCIPPHLSYSCLCKFSASSSSLSDSDWLPVPFMCSPLELPSLCMSASVRVSP